MLEMFSFEASIPLHLFEYRLKRERAEVDGHSFYEIGYCAEGSGRFRIGETETAVGPGSVLLFPPYEPHIGESDEDRSCRWYFAYFDERLLPSDERKLLRAFVRPGVWNERQLRKAAPDFPELGDWFAAMLHEYEAKRPLYGTVLRARMLELVARLHRAEESRHSREEWSGRMKALERLRPALDYVASSFREPLELADAAERTGLSASRFRHLFIEGTGKRFKEYLTFVRIQEAKRLLATGDDTVTEISLACGFQSVAPFYRSFRQLVGVHPLEYRRRHSGRD